MALLRPTGSESTREFDDLRRMMDTFFNRGRSAERYPTTSRHGVYPLVNLYEDPEAYVLIAELPGIEPSDIDISIEGSTVTIRGERKIDHATEHEASLHRAERPSGNFRRAFELPAAIEADAVEATSKNGVLRLRLPKAAEHRPRQITVNEN